jgi:hypothetical protein
VEGRARADVNCDQLVTPGDARCIHKSVLDGSCTICTGGTAAPAKQTTSPVVTKSEAWSEGDSLIIRLSVSGVPSFKAFGFRMATNPKVSLGRIVRVGPTSGFAELDGHYGGYNNTLFGGYSLGEVDATSDAVFIELHCYMAEGSLNWATFLDFKDDLDGAPEFTINGNEVPVLFARFGAQVMAGGITVSWELTSDEALDSYTLYRRDGTDGLPLSIARGAVTATTGSYVDRDVVPGTTYHYELAIRTKDGDVFRSPVADATMSIMRLALYQNHPNPFNPQTTIRYDLPPGATRVRLWILDVAGHVVRTLVDEPQAGGSRSVVWNGTDDRGGGVSSGVYFYVLDAGGIRQTRKLVLLK